MDAVPHLCDDQHVHPCQTESNVGPIFLHPSQHDLMVQCSRGSGLSHSREQLHKCPIVSVLERPVQATAQQPDSIVSTVTSSRHNI